MAYVMPGKMIRTGGREHVNFSRFLPHDARNIAVGRAHDSYDTIIMFNKGRVLNDPWDADISQRHCRHYGGLVQ